MYLKLLDWCLAALAVFLIKQLFSLKPSKPLPPGPRPLPIVGNIFNVPIDKSWFAFSDWQKKYGDLLSFHILGRRFIVINSAELAIDILDKKGAIYSDRPRLTMAGDLAGWKDTLILLGYGETLRKYRRYFHRLIGSRALMQNFHPVEERLTYRFLQDILKNPNDLSTHIRKTADSIILSISYGYDVQGDHDPWVKMADNLLSQFSEMTVAGAYLVDFLPFLKHVPEWVPGASFQKTAKEYKATLYQAVDGLHQFVKDQMAAGIAPFSFVSSLLGEANLSGNDEHAIKWSAAAMYSAGAETTVSALYSFFLAMTLHPETQKAAQAEIDAVIGSDRLPTLADRAALPYVEALSKEVMRWHTVAPLSIPHASTKDDIHNGYLIPKGSYVLVNIWGILHNKQNYSEPDLFKPERFLGDHPELDPRTVAFGYGRRICPGMHLADASIFITCVTTLAVFNVTKSVENGVEIVPTLEGLAGAISHPAPFKCSITPRSPEAEALIHEIPAH
ncbi:hypothetical protein SERLA73DRAFT_168607 [Serpula lacrymans var. lacrymans S7.3]|uniref:Cytochrome P450 n=2 Tax=Serpula lacrymans var. lacrymans TaxID=341189 RepID=F8PYU3_SERL3|nr:uncharacterized protein SERLADRAFT_449399 [Serpula lacrymans var. lacrymans S7.9]EGN99056.1 hypothetical protein SERLA73DRAFT_168607 [Serpula lacrymans var. lacrymans S7.3]EGO24634.1 hypothetical protein SERLADRAFT_449399 [Serpula lacrymans var. lacrymans S7.9]